MLGPDSLEAQARDLASAVAGFEIKSRAQPLLDRFHANCTALDKAYEVINGSYRKRESLGTDAEWFLDNFHIISEAIREVRVDLPKGYQSQLPKLSQKPLAGFPRIYALALSLIAHTDSSLDEANITRFVQAYQEVSLFSIGELWAIPTVLRLGLLENLRRLSIQVVKFSEARDLAARTAERLGRDGIGSQALSLDEELRPRLYRDGYLSQPFALHLLGALRDLGPVAAAGLEWLENHLVRQQTSCAEIVQREHRRQAGNQVTVGNCVTSLRLLSALDWSVFFERISIVERLLRQDPANVYSRQDFGTRDTYRRVVEKLARGSGSSEDAIAREVLTLAQQAFSGEDTRGASTPTIPEVEPAARQVRPREHVGYYLTGDGQAILEKKIGYKPRPREWILRQTRGHAGLVYFGAIILAVLAMLAGMVDGFSAGQNEIALIILTSALALLPVSELSIGLINHFMTHVLPPRVLPKLDFKQGIDEGCATFVVMPTMLLRPESAAILLQRLEVHYLSNLDSSLFFALLTDFADAPVAATPDDQRYLQAALDGCCALNERYCQKGPERFFVFHRRRLWNSVEGRWMGWERKRGKLLEFNRLLRGAKDTTFCAIAGDISKLPRIQFVITLDADTDLPRETARRLVATIAHPLNQPVFDPAVRRVVSGYGIVQPRVCFRPGYGQRSRFARIFVGSAGIDPYSTAVSDVYQDLFGIGSFTGKGVYAVDAFEMALSNAFPVNRILSHDLIEGNYARCALASDIELLDQFPERYHAYARREHRWARGDWQILPWIFPHVPVADTPPGQYAAPRESQLARQKNPLPFLERWKIIDNLRRSLLPPSLVAILVLSWLGALPGSPLFWTALASLVLFLPLCLQASRTPWQLWRAWRWRTETNFVTSDLRCTLAQGLLSVVFLANEARLLVDAIVRTLYRLVITKKHLLEWETAASTDLRLGGGFRGFLLDMWQSCALATMVCAALIISAPGAQAWSSALPFLFAWMGSPAVAYWISRSGRATGEVLQDFDKNQLAIYARKTWAFFEQFVGDEEHWLPPDNFQEDPKGEVAHRTSPTNIGLLLLSTLAAHDLGYLSLAALVDRLKKTMATLQAMERFKGHFFNWYDTRTLKPLPPNYISTVDSGNLLGCFLALAQGIKEKALDIRPNPMLWEGLKPTVELLSLSIDRLLPPENAAPNAKVTANQTGPLAHIQVSLRELREMSNPTETDAADALNQIDRQAAKLGLEVRDLSQSIHEASPDLRFWVGRLIDQIQDHLKELTALQRTPANLPLSAEPNSRALDEECLSLADQITALTQGMDFRFLYNENRHLFSTGYNATTGILDNSHYDLLASEARLTSFLAVARAEAGKRHWFQLARPVTDAGGTAVLLSWGGSMFEYLMPQLLLRNYPGTLLAESYDGAVNRQIQYARRFQVPWGISESAYNALDSALDYQYQSFGVPGLGLKRGLGADMVVAPYATALAVLVQPNAAVANLRRLETEGALGIFGFYEALDYTPQRLADQQRPAIVRCYMAHHQGMCLVALCNTLLHDIMVVRFHREPMIRAAELLLQERLSRSAPILSSNPDDVLPSLPASETALPMSRRLITAHTPSPRTHLLSGGRYSVMITNAGAGYTRCRGLDVTRWREDRTCDSWGQFAYIRDLRSGLVWSAGYQPIGRKPEAYEVIFSADKAEFRRSDGRIDTHMEIVVSPERLADIRKITLTTRGARTHELEVTSYLEPVLNPHGADLAHPAFGKLFLETEYVDTAAALLCRRRPRSPEQQPVWAIHMAVLEGSVAGQRQFETDRAQFLGRGRTPHNPRALDEGVALSGSTGPVLDPVLSIRARIRVSPGAAASVTFVTGVADSREEALALADEFRDARSIMRTFELAWAHSQVELRHLRCDPQDIHLYQRLAGHMIFAGPELLAKDLVRLANSQGQSGLWRYGISGDLPIVLLQVSEEVDLSIARQLFCAHAYWQLKGLQADLVIVDEHPAGYFEEFYQQLRGLAASSGSPSLLDKPGGVFVLRGAQLSVSDKVLLQSAARVVLDAQKGSLRSQIDRFERPATLPAPLLPGSPETPRSNGPVREVPIALRQPKPSPVELSLLYWNGYGGFSPDSQEYLIHLDSQRLTEHRPENQGLDVAASTPAPWINVISNPYFGFLVSENGSGYTWAGNSQTNRLTPWNNDPVSDSPGEILYVRDDDSGIFWMPTALSQHQQAAGERALRTCRHGQGYTLFELEAFGVSHEITFFLPTDDAVKLILVRLRNQTTRTRRLSLTFFAEWVLGTVRDHAAANILVQLDSDSGAMLARNPFNADFGSKWAFADVSARPREVTSDRTEFLGRNGTVTAPAALKRVKLSGLVQSGTDPCCALQAPMRLKAGEAKELVFLLGQAESPERLRQYLGRYRDPVLAHQALELAKDNWDRTLNTVQVRTPDSLFDTLMNRWLLYQVLSCRVWGRSALYQSGGAFGFRDQLQDGMALVIAAPEETRSLILQAASRQFQEGDVQHWWHPPQGKGIRTRFSDDYLWLPFTVCHYVQATGDWDILNERIPYLRAPILKPDQEEDYGLPEVSDEIGTLFDHCIRAMKYGQRYGVHGLPLMGTGDWNDGMNRVGSGGKGESVWDAWFQISIFRQFAPLAESRGDRATAAWCRELSERLRSSVEEHAWDGAWYRRAYFDDGTPLGSAQNDECCIDSLPQSWAIISGAGEPERCRTAMRSVEEKLIRRADGLILLFTPPFDKGQLQPGYIKGYVPGIRENGGQYTHAATWVVQAFALLGEGAKALDLFGMLNPIRHAATKKDAERYRVEPYVVAADVYSARAHAGRGGWTWYTGSAGWLYRVGLESILGFQRRGKYLELDPCISPEWSSYSITYRHLSSTYHIQVENPRKVQRGVEVVVVDGAPVLNKRIELVNDGQAHNVQVRLG
jgi:cyclic beta-1,2-glucan synthetase